MSDSTPTPKASGSLADRISLPPKVDATSTSPASTTTDTATQAKTSWADETASPVQPETAKSVEKAQVDGSAERLGGSALLPSGEFEVEVKLSDIQGDTSSPLYSITAFDQLGM